MASKICSPRIAVFNCEFCAENSITVPVEIEVLPAVRWLVNGTWEMEWGIDLPEKEFLIRNEELSNMPIEKIHAEIEGINLEVLTELVSDILPGEDGILNLALNEDNGIKSGLNEGFINIYGEEDYFIPDSYKIPLVINAKGPEFSVERRYTPRALLKILDKIIVPKNLHIHTNIKNTGKKDIDSLIYSEALPYGWKSDGMLFAYLAIEFKGNVIPIKSLLIKKLDGGNETAFELIGLNGFKKDSSVIVTYKIRSDKILPDTILSLKIRATEENKIVCV